MFLKEATWKKVRRKCGVMGMDTIDYVAGVMGYVQRVKAEQSC